MRHLATTLALTTSVTACATVASAHGFGQRYDLPIPLSFYVWGAGATVVLSFVIVAVFFSSKRAIRPLPTLVVPLPPMVERALRLLCGSSASSDSSR